MPLKKTLGDLAAEAKMRVHEVDVDELTEDYQNALVIDVREAEERARGFIPGSVHIPRGVIERDIEKIGFGGNVSNEHLARTIVCYCGGGARSALAARSLQEMGFSDVLSLRGGFGAWGKSGKPVEVER